MLVAALVISLAVVLGFAVTVYLNVSRWSETRVITVRAPDPREDGMQE